MASNRFSDDFDDFFDTADQPSGESNKAKKSKDRASASRERGRDSDTGSQSSRASPNRHRRSRSCSSRSTASSFTDSSRSRSPRRKDRQQNDSLSRSSSAASSRSRTDSYDSAPREKGTTNRKAKVSHRRDSNVSVDTAYTTEDDKRVSNPRSRARPSLRNQAWGKEADSEKSQVRRNSTRRTSTDEKKRKQGHRGNRHSAAESDSDITDVSPISSPRNNQRELRKQPNSKPPKCISKASGVQAESKRPKNGGTRNALELNLLEKAVSELEKQTRVQSNTRRVMFEPSRVRHEQKPNYTFSDRDTHRIDQENQRLLQQIMCQMHTMDGRYTGSFSKGKKSVIPASGINRLRDHNRIEKENLALLRRLQHIKPSRGLSRQEQLSAYNTTLLHGVPISATHTPTPGGGPPGGGHQGSESRAGGGGSEAGSLARTRSLSSVQSAGTSASSLRSAQSTRRLRSRPSSAKTAALRERPPWDDRW